MIQNKPKVSVILTSFNHAKYLREAIDSALEQTFTDFELIIWDDYSADNSWEIIQSYADPRIKAFRNDETRRGIYGINRAITEVVQGEYVAIHHSDDVWHKNKIYSQVLALDDNTSLGAVFSNCHLIDDAGDLVTKPERYYNYLFLNVYNRSSSEWLADFFNFGNMLCHPSVLMRKECVESCGLYNPLYGQLGDFDMWIRLAARYEIHVMEERLVYFRVHADFSNSSAISPASLNRTNNELFQVIKQYRDICASDRIFEIFPSAKKYGENFYDLGFVLSIIALGSQLKPVRAWGSELLYEAMRRQDVILNAHKFNYLDLIRLSGTECF